MRNQVVCSRYKWYKPVSMKPRKQEFVSGSYRSSQRVKEEED
ncbi:hypothetical protein AALP_AA2G080900 [Arabis alpina]|uniref:Uncharacterized protein n=1 Tax=Arabis alpina TaxID=50452 RepID=A0A087HG14_ARAAL|nr:hypothetical protein AALP_AA2G080900 [Arabis alpina]